MNPSPTIEEMWTNGSFLSGETANANILVDEKTITTNAGSGSLTIPAQTVELNLGDGILIDAFYLQLNLFHFSSTLVVSSDKALKGKVQINDTVRSFNVAQFNAAINKVFYDFNAKQMKAMATSGGVAKYAGCWARINKLKLIIDEAVTFTFSTNYNGIIDKMSLYRKTLFL